MSLYVDAPAITAFGLRLQHLSDQLAAALSYRERYASSSTVDDGPLGTVQARIAELAVAIDHNLTTIQTVLQRSADEIKKTVEYYQTTDADQAARLDATYPE